MSELLCTARISLARHKYRLDARSVHISFVRLHISMFERASKSLCMPHGMHKSCAHKRTANDWHTQRSHAQTDPEINGKHYVLSNYGILLGAYAIIYAHIFACGTVTEAIATGYW